MSAEPLSPLGEDMVHVHEMFVSLVAGGFTERQAIDLLARIIVEQQRPSE